jgi:hypothetical protein
MEEFKMLFDRLKEVEQSAGEEQSVYLPVLVSQSASIAELMAAAQELADPEPDFLTRV